jgi:hypothetical protein
VNVLAATTAFTLPRSIDRTISAFVSQPLSKRVQDVSTSAPG